MYCGRKGVKEHEKGEERRIGMENSRNMRQGQSLFCYYSRLGENNCDTENDRAERESDNVSQPEKTHVHYLKPKQESSIR